MNIESLLHIVDRGGLELHPLSQGFSWTPHAVLNYFRYVSKGYPLGGFAFWRPLAVTQSLDGKPVAETIIDGTQRISVLYGAMRGMAAPFLDEGQWEFSQVCYHVLLDQFAFGDAYTARDPQWVVLSEFFKDEHGLGRTVSMLSQTLPKSSSLADCLPGLNRLYGIKYRNLNVEYLPADISPEEAKEAYLDTSS